MANFHPLLAMLLDTASDEPATELSIQPFLRQSIDAYKAARREKARRLEAAFACKYDESLWASYAESRAATEAYASDLADSLLIALDEDRD
jgi:hypothetical protein